MPVSLHACMLACLHACMLASFVTSLFACLLACLLACVPTVLACSACTQCDTCSRHPQARYELYQPCLRQAAAESSWVVPHKAAPWLWTPTSGGPGEAEIVKIVPRYARVASCVSIETSYCYYHHRVYCDFYDYAAATAAANEELDGSISTSICIQRALVLLV